MTLNPENLSRPEAFAEKRFRKRYRAAFRKLGACTFCQFRDKSWGNVHCKGMPDRQMGMCEHDSKLPKFRVDTETLEVFRDVA